MCSQKYARGRAPQARCGRFAQDDAEFQLEIHQPAVAGPGNNGIRSRNAEPVGEVIDRLRLIEGGDIGRRHDSPRRCFIAIFAQLDAFHPRLRLPEMRCECREVPHLPRLGQRREQCHAFGGQEECRIGASRWRKGGTPRRGQPPQHRSEPA